MIGTAVSGMLSIQFSPRAPQAEPSFYSFMFMPYFSPSLPKKRLEPNKVKIIALSMTQRKRSHNIGGTW